MPKLRRIRRNAQEPQHQHQAHEPSVVALNATTSEILAVGHDVLTISIEGAPEKVDDFEELLRPYGIVELQRTGRVALPRLERTAPRLRQVRGVS